MSQISDGGSYTIFTRLLAGIGVVPYGSVVDIWFLLILILICCDFSLVAVDLLTGVILVVYCIHQSCSGERGYTTEVLRTTSIPDE